MAGNIYVPPPPNQWAESMGQLGNFLSNLALAKIAQNFREREAEMEAARADIRLKEQQQGAERLKGIAGVISGNLERVPAEARPGEENIANTFKLGGETFRMKEQPKPVEVTIAGRKFAWIPGTEKLVSAEGAEEKSRTVEQLVRGNLRNKLGREPTEGEVLEGVKQHQIAVNSASGFGRGVAYSGLRTIQVYNPDSGETENRLVADVVPNFPTVPGVNLPGAGVPNKPPALSPQTPRAAAGKSALSQLEAQEAKVLAFAETADKNLDIALGLSDKVDRTGIPVINRWLLAGKKSIAGDKDVAAFDAALRVGINEFARVTTTATGGGVTSDQARHEVEEMLKLALTPQQIKEVVTKVLKPDMQNRRVGYEIQRQRILRGLAPGAAPNPQGETKKPTHKFVPGKGIVPVGE